jgi:cephalosporin hydroxylase
VSRTLARLAGRLQGASVRLGGVEPVWGADKTGLHVDRDNEFFSALIEKTHNFDSLHWLGNPIWQNVLDLWTIQETIFELQPALLVETGSNRGGSAYFYAQLFDLLGKGKVISIDVQRMHELEHPRVQWLIGSSLSHDVIQLVQGAADQAAGPVMVILDSDHTAAHVESELERYAPLVTPGSYILAQDGVIDTLPTMAASRPGPLVAIHRFLTRHQEFELDAERSRRFLITHHPDGWLRRRRIS